MSSENPIEAIRDALEWVRYYEGQYGTNSPADRDARDDWAKAVDALARLEALRDAAAWIDNNSAICGDEVQLILDDFARFSEALAECAPLIEGRG